jgi:hypothetical protein
MLRTHRQSAQDGREDWVDSGHQQIGMDASRGGALSSAEGEALGRGVLCDSQAVQQRRDQEQEQEESRCFESSSDGRGWSCCFVTDRRLM